MGPRLVTLQGPYTTPDWWQEGDQTEEVPGVGGGLLCHHGKNLTDRNPPPPSGSKTGVWLYVLPSTVNGLELGDQEWRDSIFLQYSIEPLYMFRHYNDCGARFSIRHSLGCNKGGLVTSCHNELRDLIADLDIKALTPTCMRKDLLINPGRAVHIGKVLQTNPNPSNNPPGMVVDSEQKGGLMIQDLWYWGTD